jgi:hypothetical protein
MVKQDFVTGRFYFEDNDRLIPLPNWLRRKLNGAEYYFLSLPRGEGENANEKA